MKRIGLGCLIVLTCSTAATQTTNCVIGAGVAQCSQPQGLRPPAPATNCVMNNGMLRCSQPQGLQPPPLPLAPTPLPPIQLAMPQPPPQQVESPEDGETQMEIQQKLNVLHEQNANIRSQLQKSDPDETTLKAAYCTGVIQYNIYDLSSMGTPSDNKITEAQRRTLYEAIAYHDEMLAKQQQLLYRAKSYIYPRLSNLNVEPLLAARKQGYSDASQLQSDLSPGETQCREQSVGKDGMASCLVTVLANSAIYQHTKICHDLSFLPY